MTIKRRLVFGFIVVMSIISTIVAVSYSSGLALEEEYVAFKNELNPALRTVDRLKQVSGELNLLLSPIETGQVVQNKEARKASKAIVSLELPKLLEALETLKLTKLAEEDVHFWFEELRKDSEDLEKQIDLIIAASGTKKGGDPACHQVLSSLPLAMELIDRINHELSVVSNQYKEDYEQGQSDLLDRIREKETYMLIVGLIGLLLVMSLAFAGYIAIVRPLQAIEEAAKEIEAGNYSAEILPGGDAEIQKLIKAFNQMRLALEVSFEKVEKQSLMLDDLYKNAPDAYLVLSLDGEIVRSNRQANVLFGLGTGVTSIFDALESHQAEALKAFIKEVVDGQVGQELTVDLMSRGGKRKHTIVHATPITDVNGSTYQLRTSWRDVTSLIEYQNKIDNLNNELSHFAYVASHDLQEPLRVVDSYLMVLQEDYGETLGADANLLITNAVSGATRMRVLIQDLLEFSELDKGEWSEQEVDLNKLLVELYEDIKILVHDKGAEIETTSLPVVMGDKGQLKQLFQNLVTNALKFQPDDPAHKVKVEIGMSEQQGVQVFWVKDNGIGIEKKYFDRIFALFQRLHRRSQYDGTGIGLAFCDRIVKFHKGELWLESVEGEGTTFFFTVGQARPSE